MRHSISPYQSNVKISGCNVFLNGKYLGYVDKVQNWGMDFLARMENATKPNKFFVTKTQAVQYMIGDDQ